MQMRGCLKLSKEHVGQRSGTTNNNGKKRQL